MLGKTQIILDNNYEDELAYLFNVYKDDIDPMQVQTEAFSMSTMFQGSNCKKHFLISLEPLHPTKCALIPNLPSNINQSSNFLHP